MLLALLLPPVERGNFTFSISATTQHSLLHFQLLRLTCAQAQHHAVVGIGVIWVIGVSVTVLVFKGKGKPAHKVPSQSAIDSEIVLFKIQIVLAPPVRGASKGVQVFQDLVAAA